MQSTRNTIARSRSRKRRALTLLELIVASTLMTMMVTAVGVLLRGSYTVWSLADYDHSVLDSGYATLRHVVRNLRQAEAVSAISAAADNSGGISLLLPSGQTVVYDHSGSTVNYGVTTASNLLAENIYQLNFVGYKADGVTATTVPAEIQSVKVTVRVNLQREVSPTRTISSWVWLRSW